MAAFFCFLVDLDLVCAAQHIYNFVPYHFLDGGTGGCEVLPGVEMGGILGQVLSYGSSEGQPEVRIDIDLAYGH